MDTKPTHLPPMLGERLALLSAAAMHKPTASNVIPFARETAAKPISHEKKLRAINAANAEFWRNDAEQLERLKEKHGSDEKAHRVMQAARPIVDAFTLKAGATSHAAAVAVVEGQQKARAKQPRPQRSKKHATRNARICTASADGRTAAQIAKIERLSASQVRKILGLKK